MNPARKDGLVLNHWRRVADEGKEYPFAKFNKEIEIPTYADAEYAQVLWFPLLLAFTVNRGGSRLSG